MKRTLNDVLTALSEADQRIAFFGADEVFVRAYEYRKKELAAAISEESDQHGHGLLNKLPLNTELGPKSRQLYVELKKWYSEQ